MMKVTFFLNGAQSLMPWLSRWIIWRVVYSQYIYIAMSATFCLFILYLPSISSVLASAQLRAVVGGGLSLQVDLRPSVSGLKSMFSISKDFSKHSFVFYIVISSVLNNNNSKTAEKEARLVQTL